MRLATNLAMNQTKTIGDVAPKARRGERRMGTGGVRLAGAFATVSRLPALDEARRRVLAAASRPAVSPSEIAELVERDAALVIALLQAANNSHGPPGRTTSVVDAIEELRGERLAEIVDGLDTYDPLTKPGSDAQRYERFRRHALAVRLAAERIADLARIEPRDELAVAALFHDVGRLVLGELYGHEYGLPLEGAETPEARLRSERRELGIDHALVGAVLIRRWGLPASVATAVERHHADDARGLAAAVQLADRVVHHARGDRIAPDLMCRSAADLGIGEEALQALLFEFPHTGERRSQPSEPCPLSAREMDALRGLAEGKVYKQIAQELSLSVSTVRTHLHNVYGKIGAVDRAQAVLFAKDRGWL